MSDSDKRLTDWLWRPDEEGRPPRVYFLADAARDERIYALVQSSWLDSTCLYDGDLPLEFRRTAPYLAELEPRNEETREILDLGWGNAWGVFLHADAEMEELKAHFRTLLTVRDEQGKMFFFRFYDPRVLRAYLPTCTREELKTVFGPVDAFLLEGDEPGKRLTFRIPEDED